LLAWNSHREAKLPNVRVVQGTAISHNVEANDQIEERATGGSNAKVLSRALEAEHLSY